MQIGTNPKVWSIQRIIFFYKVTHCCPIVQRLHKNTKCAKHIYSSKKLLRKEFLVGSPLIFPTHTSIVPMMYSCSDDSIMSNTEYCDQWHQKLQGDQEGHHSFS